MSSLCAKSPHDHKGHSEEKCVRCGWVMGHLPERAAAERALADQLADALRDEARNHTLRGNAARALDAYQEARRER
jgi:hypothetical protein